MVLLEALDIKVQRSAAGALRTLAFKNEGNKEQVIVVIACFGALAVIGRSALRKPLYQVTRPLALRDAKLI